MALIASAVVKSPVRTFGVVLLTALLAWSCNSAGVRPEINPNDPFDDPFFREGLDDPAFAEDVWGGPAPDSDWNSSGDGLTEADLLRQHADPYWELGEDSPLIDEVSGKGGEKTLMEKAEEATLATMSVLIGAGMVALPYLIGAM